MPTVSSALEPRVFAVIASQCARLRVDALAIGGIEDHVHVLLGLHPAVSVATVVQAMKGGSSYEVRDCGSAWTGWQRGYGAVTVHYRDAPAVADYVRRQRERHASGRADAELEKCADDAEQ